MSTCRVCSGPLHTRFFHRPHPPPPSLQTPRVRILSILLALQALSMPTGPLLCCQGLTMLSLCLNTPSVTTSFVFPVEKSISPLLHRACSAGLLSYSISSVHGSLSATQSSPGQIIHRVTHIRRVLGIRAQYILFE